MTFVLPFKEKNLSTFSYFVEEVKKLSKEYKAQQIVFFILVNFTFTSFLLLLCHFTNSIALLAYTYFSWFTLLSLVTCLICLWAKKQKATLHYTFGYSRCEVLSIFTSVMLCMFGSIYIVKESFERIFLPEKVNPGLLSTGGLIGLILHLVMVAFTNSPPLSHVINTSKSSILQEELSHLFNSICIRIPILRAVTTPRMNPFVLISCSGFITILCNQLVIQIYNHPRADTFCSLIIAIITMTTLYPLCISSGKILLQTIPNDLVVQLDKCLHEALTLDGVLEFRNEHFWVVGPSATKGGFLDWVQSYNTIVAGNLSVRIRRDANEQLVLTHVRERLSSLVKILTVQVFKDDWTRGSTTLQLLKGHPNIQISKSPHPDYINIDYTQSYINSAIQPDVSNSHFYKQNQKHNSSQLWPISNSNSSQTHSNNRHYSNKNGRVETSSFKKSPYYVNLDFTQSPEQNIYNTQVKDHVGLSIR